MRKVRSFLVLAFCACMMFSCDDSTSEVALDAVGDVFVRCKKVGDETQYAPIYYAYSNYVINAASVDGPDVDDLDLAPVFNGAAVFHNLAEGASYSTEDVENGTYTFTVTNNTKGTLTVTDVLLSQRIDPVEITTFEYDEITHDITIDWEDVEDTDVYVVKIENEIDGNDFYISEFLTKSQISSDDFQLSGKWYGTPVGGNSYVVGVFAYKFENSSYHSGYDINCESVEYRDIQW